MNRFDDTSADHAHTHELSELDARALEALLECRFDCSQTPPDIRDRAVRCQALLSALSSGGTPVLDSSLVDITLVRVARMRRDVEHAALMPHDEDALEALVAAGFDPAKCPGSLRSKAQSHAHMLESLHVPIADVQREALVSGTLSFVQAQITSAERKMAIAEPRRLRPQWRMSDLISVAALLLIGGAVLAPMVNAARGITQSATCQAGMASTMQGFATYAADFRDALPMASASPAGQTYWNIGKPQESNSANLYTLVRTHRLKATDLACPGNAQACRSGNPDASDWTCSSEISYSYQNMFASERSAWTQPEKIVVLADRSPVMVRAMVRQRFNPVANSDNHMGRGQNALFNDGSVQWLRSPVLVSGDNIWLPRPAEELFARLKNPDHADGLSGKESPEGKTDVFLTP